MTSLVLGLALSTPSTAVGGPPGYPPTPYPPLVRPLPQVPGGPVLYPPTPFPPGPQFPPPGPPVPPGPPAMTLEQFSRTFSPTPGKHHVWLIHPKTCQPVFVCFTLPKCGKLERFEVNKRSIEFEFDRPDVEVEIIFRHNGTVDVKYRD